MHQDVVDLRAFYYRTPLGRSAQRALQEALRALWPETRGSVVVGFGFAAPATMRGSKRRPIRSQAWAVCSQNLRCDGGA